MFFPLVLFFLPLLGPARRVLTKSSNKAQLRDLESIRSDLLRSKRSLSPTLQEKNEAMQNTPAKKFRKALVAVRFIARMRVAAGAWGVQEEKRRRIVECVEGMRAKKGRGAGRLEGRVGRGEGVVNGGKSDGCLEWAFGFGIVALGVGWRFSMSRLMNGRLELWRFGSVNEF